MEGYFPKVEPILIAKCYMIILSEACLCVMYTDLAARLGPSFLWDLDRFCLILGLLKSYPLRPVGRQSAPGAPWACHWPSWASHGILQPASPLCPAQLERKSKRRHRVKRGRLFSCCDTCEIFCEIFSSQISAIPGPWTWMAFFICGAHSMIKSNPNLFPERMTQFP